MIIDGHNDLVLRTWREQQTKHVDLSQARAADFCGGFFAIWVPGAPGAMDEPVLAPYDIPLEPQLPRAHAVEVAREQLAAFRSLGLPVATSADDFVDGRVTAILHLEGAEALDPMLTDLVDWYREGLRSLGLVWARRNVFAEGVPFRFPGSPDTGPGLTIAGVRLVEACNDLGIVVDLSHLNEKGFWDVAGITTAPLVATHSNAHALCASTRNLTDRQLDAIGTSGGVVGVNFAVGFLREDGTNVEDTPLTEIVRHVSYIAKRIGIDHVAFGSDFDGAVVSHEVGGIQGFPAIVSALAEAGFDEQDIAKITHRNWLRVLRETWR